MEVKILTVSDFIKHVNAILSERPTYRLGGSGTDGTCDCIGLIIGAVRRAGGAWTGTHGSNYAARYEMQELAPITLGNMFVGMAVYKAREPGQANYDLPDKYGKHTDQKDYYHVGVVVSVKPLQIAHVSGPGALIDTKQEAWKYGGRLTKVDYGEAVKMATAKVTAQSGSTVNIRDKPNGALVARVPVGDVVAVIEAGPAWSKVAWDRYEGYIQVQYLAGDGDLPGGSDGHDRSVALAADIRAVLNKYGV